MNHRKHLQWLYRELPSLMNDGVLTAEAVEKLRAYYGEIKESSKKRIALIVFSALGASLVGLGIILLLAHNWDELSRGARTALSITPLVLGQALAGWTLIKKRDSVAWREGTAIFLSLAVGASISLVAQTYHISGDAGRFFLTWMLLTIPLVYLLDASSPVLIYLWGMTTWAGIRQNEAGHALFFWPLAALIIPHFLRTIKENRYSVRSIILAWGISICLCVAAGLAMEHTLPGLWIITYSGLFAALFLAGNLWLGEAPTIWQRPFQTVGVAGVVVLAFVLTYKWPWQRIGWQHYRTGIEYHQVAAIFDFVLVSAFLLFALYLLIARMRDRGTMTLLFGALPLVSVLCFVAISFDADKSLAMILFNVYLFILGVVTTATGIRNLHLGTVNAGMLILSALIIARFFDSEVGFVIRGLAFIIVGIGFLLTNWIIIRRSAKS